MNSTIMSAFKNFTIDGNKIPVAFLRYDGNSTSYVTFMQTDADEALSADDNLVNYVEYYDFDVYSKGNYTNIVEGIKLILEAHGFRWQPSRDSEDMFEDDTGYYHKTLSFAIERSN